MTLSHAMPYDISVPYYTSDISAIESKDYTSASGTVDFPANSTTPQTITVPTLLDQANTAGLTFYVNLGSTTNTNVVWNRGMGLIEPLTGSLTVCGRTTVSDITLLRVDSANLPKTYYTSFAGFLKPTGNTPYVVVDMLCGPGGSGNFELNYTSHSRSTDFFARRTWAGCPGSLPRCPAERPSPRAGEQFLVYGIDTSQFLRDSSITLQYDKSGMPDLTLSNITATVANVDLWRCRSRAITAMRRGPTSSTSPRTARANKSGRRIQTPSLPVLRNR